MKAQCPKCGANNSDGSAVCSTCGLDLACEFENTRVSDDRRRDPTAVMPSAFETGHSSFAPGTVLAGRYRLIMQIGKGGMGEVYKADDLELGQAVAVKFLPAAVAKDEAALKRFRGEVRTARQVAHQNVCRVFDIAESNGTYFITMEYVDGDDLSMLLRRIGRLPQDKAVETARQLCLGLHAIHEAGILHRDLKPANIIIDSRGKARITDFGIAGAEAEITKDDLRSGTPAYMSPEQLNGEAVSQKSDIYSLGLLMYEIFTGKQAIQFDSLADLVLKHQTTTPTDPSEILKEIDPLVEKTILQCLAKEPDDRPQTALQVAMMLPGGDPLQAALAAGETPSPAMVAAAPKKGALSPKSASLFLAAILALLGFNAAMEYTYWVIPTGERTSELLAARSRDIAANLGYPDNAVDTKYGFDADLVFYEGVFGKVKAFENARELMSTGQPSPRAFRYRESPRPIVPSAGSQVTVQDPVMENPGELRVTTDPVGRLLEFHAIPTSQVQPGPAPPVNWEQLFVEAGMDPLKYEEVPVDHAPPVFADERRKWKGPFVSDPSMSVEIEAAAFQGKPVHFRLIMPWAPESTSAADLFEPPKWIVVSAFILASMILLAVVVLSWHNFRTGRGDLTGSLRVMVFLLLVRLLSGMFLADHAGSLFGEMGIISIVIRDSVFLSVLAGLMYSALEPQLRRLWPELLISWSRLLSGDVRDPMIGRDILIGTFLGAAGYSIGVIQNFIPFWFTGAPLPPFSHYFRWDGFFRGLADSLSWVPSALTATLSVTFILFIVLLLTRRKWVAAVVVGALYSIAGLGAAVPISLVFEITIMLLISATLLIALLRFGIVGLVAHQLLFQGLMNRPFVFNPQSIYFDVSIAGALIILAIVFYAFITSVGGRLPTLTTLLEGTENS